MLASFFFFFLNIWGVSLTHPMFDFTFMWGVSLTHPVLASFFYFLLLFFIRGVCLTHPMLDLLSCGDFYEGSFSYTSRVGF